MVNKEKKNLLSKGIHIVIIVKITKRIATSLDMSLTW